MKPAAFEYAAPLTIDEAVGALASNEEARVLAGGQSLVPMMNLRLARPQLLVDCNRVAELDTFEVNGDTVRLGAFCRHRRIELDPEIGDAVPLLAEAAALVGYPQIRNRATIGGSLAHGDPAAELGAACVALGARVNLRSTTAERTVPIADFFDGFFTTAVQAGELLVSVDVAARKPNTGYAFREYAPRHGDFALAGVAAIVERGADGNVASVRLAGCGIGRTVVDISDAATPLVGSALDDARLRDVAALDWRADEPVRRHARVGRVPDRAGPADGSGGAARRVDAHLGKAGGVTSNVKFAVNGDPVEVEVEPRDLLLDVLRGPLGLTGAHAGCEQGVCGTCTVLVDGVGVRSCLMFAVQVGDTEITTIEGVGSAEALHPLQQAFHEQHGLQCGYCTPGMVLTALELLRRNAHPTRDEIERGMSGNLCRCTGYAGIIDAIEAAARAGAVS